MSGRDLATFQAETVRCLGTIGADAVAADDVEAALGMVTGGVFDLLGDRTAHERPGALRAGEHQFFVAGVFLVTPDQGSHLLVAERGFPPEQHRLRFPIDTGHPGAVYRSRQPLILENTDDHADFKQILKTARMGSALYAPLLWRGEMLGQMLMAAQARNTFSAPDLEAHVAFAALATAIYMANDGPAFLNGLV